jgi:transposase
VSLASIARAHLLEPKDFAQQYRDHLSDFHDWQEKDHAAKWLIFPENVGKHLSIDEVEVSGGELYTIVTNKARHGQAGCLVAVAEGTKAETVSAALCRITEPVRAKVRSVTRDLAQSMEQIITASFLNATQIDDRFHVQQMVSDALQETRIELRKEAIKEHNTQVAEKRKQHGHYWAPRFENGDTVKELLARSRYLLYKPSGKWTKSQKARAAILFREYPALEEAYRLTMHFRGIYEHAKNPADARRRLHRWYVSVEKRLNKFPSFETPLQTIRLAESTIVNYFINWETNAAAESFNAKVKNFRALQRGVRDVTFFLFRLAKIYG